jgi:hypothetical protein
MAALAEQAGDDRRHAVLLGGLDSALVAATLVAMGTFKPDALPIGDLAKTTVAAQNIITPASGMSHVVDAFAGGSRDLTYGATTTIPNSAELPIRHRVALTGDTTLAWTSPSPGQRGTLDIYPDTSTRTVTLPSLAYSPTGSTFTVAGGTGSTNYVRAMWEVHQVGGTNRITVVPTAIYR